MSHDSVKEKKSFFCVVFWVLIMLPAEFCFLPWATPEAITQNSLICMYIFFLGVTWQEKKTDICLVEDFLSNLSGYILDLSVLSHQPQSVRFNVIAQTV